jgi:hypothetical protein
LASEPRAITEIAERAAEQFHREQSERFLECSINLCATSMSMADLIRLLRSHAEMLEEFG